MNMQEFVKKVSLIVPELHSELFRRQPAGMLKQKMTLSQMIIMGLLDNAKECKMSGISKALGVTKSAVTGIAGRLIRSGFAKRTRSSNDRRVVILSLAPKGRAAYRKFDSYKMNLIKDAFECLNQKERLFYLRILKKVRRNLKKKRASKT